MISQVSSCGTEEDEASNPAAVERDALDDDVSTKPLMVAEYRKFLLALVALSVGFGSLGAP